MHGTREDGRSNLEVRRTYAPDREVIQMIIPSGCLNVSRMSDQDYWIEPYGDRKYRSDLTARKAAEFEVHLELNPGRGLSIIEADGQSSRVRSYAYTEGGSQRLEFNNHCDHAHGGGNDFIFYYDWVYDTTSIGRDRPKYFLAGKHNPGVIENVFSGSSNCDPSGIEPPPLP
jgi:hypothetical protein